MYNITIQFASDKKRAPKPARLRQWAEKALENQMESAELNIRIVDINEMSKLNSVYRRKNGPTNVLSFPSAIHDEVELETPILGDIVICTEVVNSEAREQQKSEEAHWAHMVVHGVFHLLGYDHESNNEAEIMESLEKQVMRDLGFKDPYEVGEE